MPVSVPVPVSAPPGEQPATPATVEAALARAEAAGFTLSSEPGVGALLAALAAAVPESGRILELGTGAGAGLAWLVHGVGSRRDVEVVSVDVDATLQQVTGAAGWPEFVRFELGDGAELVGELGSFDLIFADAPGGKLTELSRTVAALAPGGVLVVDDMDLALHDDEALRESLAGVRARLLANPQLVCAELTFSSGVILCTKRHA
jgi:predicted O-methyltransferase YrrM